MPKSFKQQYNHQSISALGKTITANYPDFPLETFVLEASHKLESLEFKARSQQITQALVSHLPHDFADAIATLMASLAPDFAALGLDAAQAGWTTQDFAPKGISGWMIMPCADFVAHRGLTEEYFELSMTALEVMTSRFSAEFAIRPFLRAFPKRTLVQCLHWTKHPNQHVRRLASEGTRPVLPWGIKLPELGADPKLSLPILDALKDDPSDYVRKSVANHLNDHSKLHPDWVCDTATSWWQLDKTRQRLLKHGCRTLLKQGHIQTLALFGFEGVQANVQLSLSKKTIIMGESLDINLSIQSRSTEPQLMMIDYIVWHQKANGTKNPKVFKWKEIVLTAGQTVEIVKTHTIKPITTRTYYAGEHSIEVQINGKACGQADFELQC